MARIQWDLTGERFYETGVDRGVLYQYGTDGRTLGQGVAWNGLTNVTQAPEGAEPTKLYADNIEYLSLMSAETFGATIEAYTYPVEFAQNDGSAKRNGVFIGQQNRRPFGFSYRTLIGNDVEGNDLGYKIHLIYNAMASPSEKANPTINDTPEAVTFSWEITTTPVQFEDHDDLNPTALITIDSREVTPEQLKALEDVLYGQTDEPRMPTPDEVLDLFGGPTL